MACSTQIRWEDWAFRAVLYSFRSASVASFDGFLGGALTGSGKARASPWYPESTLALTSGYRRSRSSMPSVRSAVTSCMRPGRAAPQQSPVTVADHGGFDRVLFLLARYERPPAWPVHLRP